MGFGVNAGLSGLQFHFFLTVQLGQVIESQSFLMCETGMTKISQGSSRVKWSQWDLCLVLSTHTLVSTFFYERDSERRDINHSGKQDWQKISPSFLVKASGEREVEEHICSFLPCSWVVPTDQAQLVQKWSVTWIVCCWKNSHLTTRACISQYLSSWSKHIIPGVFSSSP